MDDRNNTSSAPAISLNYPVEQGTSYVVQHFLKKFLDTYLPNTSSEFRNQLVEILHPGIKDKWMTILKTSAGGVFSSLRRSSQTDRYVGITISEIKRLSDTERSRLLELVNSARRENIIDTLNNESHYKESRKKAIDELTRFRDNRNSQDLTPNLLDAIKQYVAMIEDSELIDRSEPQTTSQTLLCRIQTAFNGLPVHNSSEGDKQRIDQLLQYIKSTQRIPVQLSDDEISLIKNMCQELLKLDAVYSLLQHPEVIRNTLNAVECTNEHRYFNKLQSSLAHSLSAQAHKSSQIEQQVIRDAKEFAKLVSREGSKRNLTIDRTDQHTVVSILSSDDVNIDQFLDQIKKVHHHNNQLRSHILELSGVLFNDHHTEKLLRIASRLLENDNYNPLSLICRILNISPVVDGDLQSHLKAFIQGCLGNNETKAALTTRLNRLGSYIRESTPGKNFDINIALRKLLHSPPSQHDQLFHHIGPLISNLINQCDPQKLSYLFEVCRLPYRFIYEENRGITYALSDDSLQNLKSLIVGCLTNQETTNFIRDSLDSVLDVDGLINFNNLASTNWNSVLETILTRSNNTDSVRQIWRHLGPLVSNFIRGLNLSDWNKLCEKTLLPFKIRNGHLLLNDLKANLAAALNEPHVLDYLRINLPQLINVYFDNNRRQQNRLYAVINEALNTGNRRDALSLIDIFSLNELRSQLTSLRIQKANWNLFFSHNGFDYLLIPDSVGEQTAKHAIDAFLKILSDTRFSAEALRQLRHITDVLAQQSSRDWNSAVQAATCPQNPERLQTMYQIITQHLSNELNQMSSEQIETVIEELSTGSGIQMRPFIKPLQLILTFCLTNNYLSEYIISKLPNALKAINFNRNGLIDVDQLIDYALDHHSELARTALKRLVNRANTVKTKRVDHPIFDICTLSYEIPLWSQIRYIDQTLLSSHRNHSFNNIHRLVSPVLYLALTLLVIGILITANLITRSIVLLQKLHSFCHKLIRTTKSPAVANNREASQIQRPIRAFLARRLQQKRQLRHASSSKIQKHLRRFFVKNRQCNSKLTTTNLFHDNWDRNKKLYHLSKASSTITRLFLKRKKHQSSIAIQRIYRNYLLHRDYLQRRRRQQSSIAIQKIFRGYLQRKPRESHELVQTMTADTRINPITILNNLTIISSVSILLAYFTSSQRIFSSLLVAASSPVPSRAISTNDLPTPSPLTNNDSSFNLDNEEYFDAECQPLELD